MEIYIPKWVLIVFIIVYTLKTALGWLKWYYEHKIEKMKSELNKKLTERPEFPSDRS